MGEEFKKQTDKFTEVMSSCEQLLDFHKRQFTKASESEVTQDNVPEHMQ